MATRVFQKDVLARCIEAVVAAGGSEAREAKIVAENLVTANLTGHDSHGVGMAPRYVASLLNNELQLNRRVSIVSDASSLLVIDAGVILGRAALCNMNRYLRTAASSNFGNVLSVLVASAFLPFLPMLPIQLLVQNLLYDLSQAALPFFIASHTRAAVAGIGMSTTP